MAVGETSLAASGVRAESRCRAAGATPRNSAIALLSVSGYARI